MLFADDIIICSKDKQQAESLDIWRYVLECRGMKVSRNKTEYTCMSGNGKIWLQEVEVKEFKYLGTTMKSNGEHSREVKKEDSGRMKQF